MNERAPRFSDALEAIRKGAPCSLCGSTLVVNGVAMSISDEEFDLAWDAMGERDDENESVIRLA